MQTLKLSDDLMKEVLAMRKYGTCRLGRRDIQLGELKLEATDGTVEDILVEVTQVAYMQMREVPETAAVNEGYLTVEQLFRRMKVHYPDMLWNDEVTIIVWRSMWTTKPT